MVNLNYLGEGRGNKRINRLERGDQLGRSSVSHGTTRFIGEESLSVEGSQKITGRLFGSGVIEWEGDATFDGDVKITETLDVTAATTLGAELKVKPGGKITVEGPSAATLQNGELSFATGGKVVAYPNGAAVAAGSAQVVASTAGALLFFGTNNIGVTSSGTGIDGGLTVNGAVDFNSIPVKAGAVANLHIDSTGKLWKTS